MKTLIIAFAVSWLSAGVPFRSGPQSTEASTSRSEAKNSASAKVEERKRRFEEEKQRIQDDEPDQTPPCTPGSPTLYITPTEAGMLVGESRGFTLFDTAGHKVTADAEWSVSSSDRAALTPGDEPTVTARSEGTFKVIARIDTRSAEATVKVYPGDKLPIGAIRWRVAPIPCSKNPVISNSVKAAPH
jgi:plastocyanin